MLEERNSIEPALSGLSRSEPYIVTSELDSMNMKFVRYTHSGHSPGPAGKLARPAIYDGEWSEGEFYLRSTGPR